MSYCTCNCGQTFRQEFDQFMVEYDALDGNEPSQRAWEDRRDKYQRHLQRMLDAKPKCPHCHNTGVIPPKFP